jgi:hypothetical protein
MTTRGFTGRYVRETPWPFHEHPAWAKAQILDAAAGEVRLIGERRERVAIVGFADSCRELAPFDDARWEIWGLNQLARFIPRAERWFEIHHRTMFEADVARGTDYLGWLRAGVVPTYMLDVLPEFPASVRYPIERVRAYFGREYLTSTPAYMVALAILEGFSHIGVYGIDLIIGREYAWEKPCLEYWLGQAEARGIVLDIPYPESALLKQGVRYGLPDGTSADGAPAMRVGGVQIRQLQETLLRKREELVTGLNNCDGALQAVKSLLEADEIMSRGGALPSFTVR